MSDEETPASACLEGAKMTHPGQRFLAMEWGGDVPLATSNEFYRRLVALAQEMLPAASVYALGLTRAGNPPLDSASHEHGHLWWRRGRESNQ